jgi:hypothetical protein
MHQHSTSLFEDVSLKRGIFIRGVKKRNAVINHPLLGGVKLMNDRTKTTWGGFRQMKEKLIAVVNIASDEWR